MFADDIRVDIDLPLVELVGAETIWQTDMNSATWCPPTVMNTTMVIDFRSWPRAELELEQGRTGECPEFR